MKIREGCNTIAFVELCLLCIVWERLAILTVQQTRRKGRKFDMTHYKQIIVNLAVEDHTDTEMLKEFAEELQEFFEEKQKEHGNIKEVSVKVG